MLAAIAQGRSEIRNWLAAGDTEATLGAMRDLGVQIERHDANTLSIEGGGMKQAARSAESDECGNGHSLARRYHGWAGIPQRPRWQRAAQAAADEAHYRSPAIDGRGH